MTVEQNCELSTTKINNRHQGKNDLGKKWANAVTALSPISKYVTGNWFDLGLKKVYQLFELAGPNFPSPTPVVVRHSTNCLLSIPTGL